MAHTRSRDAFFDFLDYLAKKGLMAKNTIAARRASAGKVLGILSEEEATDVTRLDFDSVVQRFQNLEGKKYTPGSLNTYVSRTRSALDDFETYVGNPMGFSPSVQARGKHSKPESNKGKKKSPRHGNDSISIPSIQNSPLPPGSSILPIPIRGDVTVHVQGLPFDLSEAEANKIANVIRAMATPA